MMFGFFSLFVVFSIGIILCLRWPGFFNIFLVAFLIRVILIFYSNYAGDLFDGTADARKYETYAWTLAQEVRFEDLILAYPGAGGYSITWPISILYSIFGRNLMIAQSLSLFCGLGSVFLAWYIIKEIWGEKFATKAGWLIALYPPMVLYSCLVLREAYIYFFLLIAFWGVYKWSKFGETKYFILTILGFVGAIHYHGGMFVGLFVFLTIVASINFISTYYSLKRGTINSSSLILISILIFSLVYFISGKIEIPKLGNINNILDVSRIFDISSRTMTGDASYPDWLSIQNSFELTYKPIFRGFYFLISPLPWDVKKIFHFFGMLDGLFYLFILTLIFMNRKSIILNPGLRNISIILFFLIILFGLGVGNFGTGLRHRAKFFIPLIILAAPLLPKLIFFKKKVTKYD